MLKRLVPRSGFDLMAMAALFLALTTGTVYAANEWTGANIVDESLTGADVRGKYTAGTTRAVNGTITGADISGQAENAAIGQAYYNGTVTTWDISDNTVRSRDVEDGGIKGADVLESSLGQVPSAAQADTATSVAAGEVWHYIGDPGQPAFENGWGNYSGGSHADATYQHAAYMKDKLGVVHIRGLIAGGTVGTAAFELSGTYCPWYFHAFPVLSNDALGRVTVEFVQPWCNVIVQGGSNPAWVSFEGVSYQEWPREVGGSSGSAAAQQSQGVGPGGVKRSTR